jgi:acyl-CoA thioester hydrolase
MNDHVMDYRVSYADVDKMGVMYYARHFVLFERGRTEWLRSRGMRYRDWEENLGIMLPVVEAECRYSAPLRYDDLVRVRTWVEELRGASVNFAYELTEAETGRVLARGKTRHPFVGRDGRPARVPAEIRNNLISGSDAPGAASSASGLTRS